ncbi:MAG TPA: GNAT family N-acetyltransferase [Gemmatimonadaceae bacterium]|nr:GNAT family N-acetyltransferase [Gemmatimonadaceae bacterium]
MLVAPVTLEGDHVRLEPLTPAHVEPLTAVATDEELWRLTTSRVRDAEELREYVEHALRLQQAGSALPFAIVDRASGRAAGSTRYANIDLANRRLEIGWTWLGRPFQRTALNTEAKLLLVEHAIERLGCMRVEFKTDALNERSRAALLRIGAREEGTLRKHSVTWSGHVRDSVYYSIIDEEWPSVKAMLKDKLQRAAARAQ